MGAAEREAKEKADRKVEQMVDKYFEEQMMWDAAMGRRLEELMRRLAELRNELGRRQ